MAFVSMSSETARRPALRAHHRFVMLEFVAVLVKNSHGQVLPRGIAYFCDSTLLALRLAINIADLAGGGLPLAMWCTGRAPILV